MTKYKDYIKLKKSPNKIDKLTKRVTTTRNSRSTSTLVKVTHIHLSDEEMENSADGFSTSGVGGGDPQVVGSLYKSRRNHNKKKFCNHNPHGLAKCWAFTNLVVSMVDMLFSLYEIMATTTRLKDSQENDGLHGTIYVVTIALHGDCTETAVEVTINFIGELFFVISSLLFAFATTLKKEDFLITRCLVQWFIFSVWFPPLALFPRFLLNIVSTCGINSAKAFGPRWNEHGPRIVFWIANLTSLFFIVAWLAHSRHVAVSFLHYLKEVEQRQSTVKVIQTGSGKVLTVVPGSDMSISQVGNAGDKVLERSPLSGILPSSLPMV